MHRFKNLIPILAISTGLPGLTYATPYYTLSQTAQSSGPITGAPGQTDQQYVTALFETLVKSADGIVKADNPTLNGYYWAFLVAALAVPSNESDLKHFQYLPQLGNACDPQENSGALLSGGTLKVFKKYLQSAENPFIPTCAKLDKSSPAVQLLGSEDHLSVGLMQLTLDYHEDTYVAPGYYKSVADTAQVGLEQLYAGYSEVYHNFEDKQYTCLRTKGNASQINYENLIRGTWSGPYNSGNSLASSVCRFNDPNSQYASSDITFMKGLQKVLTGTSFFEVLDGNDKLAFDEIIDNFLNQSTTHTALDQVLQNSTVVTSDIPSPPTPVDAAMTKITSGNSLNVRSGPSTENSICSTLNLGTSVTVNDTIDDADGENWSKISLSTPCNGSNSGYVLSSLLTDPPADATTETAANFSGTVTGTFVNVRTSAPTGNILEVVKKGDVLKIIGSRRTSDDSVYPWYQVSPSKGWISGRYISAE